MLPLFFKRLRWSGRLSPSGVPKRRLKIRRGSASAGMGWPDLLNESVPVLAVYPIPLSLDNTNDGIRVCFSVSLAITWSIEIELL